MDRGIAIPKSRKEREIPRISCKLMKQDQGVRLSLRKGAWRLGNPPKFKANRGYGAPKIRATAAGEIGKARIRIQIARIVTGISLAFAVALLSLRANAQTAAPSPDLLASKPWEYGVFVNGGVGTGNRADDKFFWAGLHAGKVLTGPLGKGVLGGQFEVASELIPVWQAYTPKYLRANCYAQPGGSLSCSTLFPTGGTYTGVSITPLILRWNLSPHGRFRPWIQGAGGLIWTDHKFPPIGPYPVPRHLGTSVFNYTPQFGVGAHYFIKPKQSISLSANAIHISNASMGDSNPGVNASVQFSLGYTWWK